MKSFFSAARVAALFVGSVVGAGFATGQEISLFFGGGSPLGPVIAAVFMGVMCFVFMEVGLPDGRARRVFDVVVAVASFVVYGAMIAAAEEVLSDLTALRGLSLLLALGSAALTVRGAEKMAWLNLVAVPLMIAVVLVVGCRSAAPQGGGARLLAPFAYGAMNMLFSGALMASAGERLSRRERVTAAVLATVMILALLLAMYRAVAGVPRGSMPFLTAASRLDLGVLVPVTLLLAIITTMTSCNYLTACELSRHIPDPLLPAALLPFAGVLFAQWGFAPIVDTLYPMVSVLGIVVTVIAFLCFLRGRKARSRTPCAALFTYGCRDSKCHL